VRKVSYGVGVERIFPVQGPVVEKVEIKSRGHVRRARLYYLRDLRGKKARLRSKIRACRPLPQRQRPAAAEAVDRDAAAPQRDPGRISGPFPAPAEDRRDQNSPSKALRMA
jgi:hypothetical protein